MELFLLLPELQLKSFFDKMFLTYPNESKIGFENRKWNDPIRKSNYYSYFLTNESKTGFLTSTSRLHLDFI